MTEKLRKAGMDVLTLVLAGILTALGETATGDLKTDVQLTLTGAVFVFLKALNTRDDSYGLGRKE